MRAFDKVTGEELWSAKLEHGGFAPPAMYWAKGKQYLVLTDTGGGKLSVPPYPGTGRPWGDGYVAFALP